MLTEEERADIIKEELVLLDTTKVQYEKQKNQMRKNLIISYSNKYRIKWDLFVILLAIYNSITLPLVLAFEPPFLKGSFLDTFDMFIDFLFLLDIIITFRTTIIDPRKNTEVIDSKMIACTYIKGRFFIDVLATVPVETIALIINPSMD